MYEHCRKLTHTLCNERLNVFTELSHCPACLGPTQTRTSSTQAFASSCTGPDQVLFSNMRVRYSCQHAAESRTMFLKHYAAASCTGHVGTICPERPSCLILPTHQPSQPTASLMRERLSNERCKCVSLTGASDWLRAWLLL